MAHPIKKGNHAICFSLDCLRKHTLGLLWRIRKWLYLWLQSGRLNYLKVPLIKLRNCAQHCCKAKRQKIDRRVSQGQMDVSPFLEHAGWLTCFKNQCAMKTAKDL